MGQCGKPQFGLKRRFVIRGLRLIRNLESFKSYNYNGLLVSNQNLGGVNYVVNINDEWQEG